MCPRRGGKKQQAHNTLGRSGNTTGTKILQLYTGTEGMDSPLCLKVAADKPTLLANWYHRYENTCYEWGIPTRI